MGSWLSRDLFQLYSPVSLVQRETNVKYIPQQLGHGNIGIMLDLYSYLFHPST